jgi:hypothetical protein
MIEAMRQRGRKRWRISRWCGSAGRDPQVGDVQFPSSRS